MVDFLDASAREEYKKHKRISVLGLGKAWANSTIDWIYHDHRIEKEPKPADLAGDSLLIAGVTLGYSETRKRIQRDPNDKSKILLKGFQRNSSLLAHELGHILFEPQSGETHKNYIDHYCPGVNDFCPDTNVLTAGGYEDYIYVDPEREKKVIGFSKLPEVEEEQCEVFRNHPKVTTL